MSDELFFQSEVGYDGESDEDFVELLFSPTYPPSQDERIVLQCSLVDSEDLMHVVIPDIQSLLIKVDDGFGVTIFQHDCDSENNVFLLFQCLPSDVHILVGKTLKVSKHHTVRFSRVIELHEEEEQENEVLVEEAITSIYYCNTVNTTIPNVVTVELVIKLVFNASGVELTEVCCEPKSSRWQFSCRTADVEELVQHASDITVKRTELFLEVTRPHNPADYSDDLSPLVPTATLLTTSEEQTHFHFLEKEMNILRHLQRTFALNQEVGDFLQNCVEGHMGRLQMHADYEFRKMNCQYLTLDSSEGTAVDGPDVYPLFTASLMSVVQVLTGLKSIVAASAVEGFDHIKTDVTVITKVWRDCVDTCSSQQSAFKTLLTTLAKIVKNVDIRGVLTELLENWQTDKCFVTQCWIPLRKVVRLFDAQSTESIPVGCQMCAIQAAWNEARDALKAGYQTLSTTCSALLYMIRPVDLHKLSTLIGDYQMLGERLDLKGKDVLAFYGPSGVGKSTLIHLLHGARFVEKRIYEDLRVHLDPWYPPGMNIPNIDKVHTSSSADSTTCAITATIVEYQGKQLYVLDIPGSGDSEGVERDIFNGLQISGAFLECKSVKFVVVWSDASLGDKLKGDSSCKSCSHTLVEMFASTASLEHISFVFTKMDRATANSISAVFKAALRSLSMRDKAIFPLWTQVANITAKGAVLADPLAANREEVLSFVYNEAGTLFNPSTEFRTCVSTSSSDAFKAQMAITRRSIKKAVDGRQVDHVHGLLRQLQKIANQTALPALSGCIEEFAVCVQHLVSHVESQFVTVRDILQSTSLVLDGAKQQSVVNAMTLLRDLDVVRREYFQAADVESMFGGRDLFADIQSLLSEHLATVTAQLHGVASLYEHNRAAVQGLCAAGLKMLQFRDLLSAAEFWDAVNECSAYLALFESELLDLKALFSNRFLSHANHSPVANLEGCLLALDDTKYFVTTMAPFHNAVAEEKAPPLQRFYLDTKKHFISVLLQVRDQAIEQLTPGLVGSDIALVRSALVSLNKLQQLLSGNSMSDRVSSVSVFSRYDEHFGEVEVSECVEVVEDSVNTLMNYLLEKTVKVSWAQFESNEIKTMLKDMRLIALQLLNLSLSNKTDIATKHDALVNYTFNLCVLIKNSAGCEMDNIVTDLRECKVDELVNATAQLRDSEFFHLTFHSELHDLARMRLEKVHSHAMTTANGPHVVTRLATANYSAKLLSEVIATISSESQSDVEVWKREIQTAFDQAFQIDGIARIKLYYESLKSDYASIRTYQAVHESHFEIDCTLRAFLLDCNEIQWCLPVDASDILRDANSLRFGEVTRHMGELEVALRKDAVWFFSDIYAVVSASKLRAPAAALAHVELVMDYLRGFANDEHHLLQFLDDRLVAIVSAFSDLLEADDTSRQTLDHVHTVASYLIHFDRFLNCDVSFENIVDRAVQSNLAVRRETERALRRNDFYTLAGHMKRMNHNSEEYTNIVEMLHNQFQAFNHSFCTDNKPVNKLSPWKSLVALSNAHHFLDSDIVQDEFPVEDIDASLELLGAHFAVEFSRIEAAIAAGRLQDAGSALLLLNDVIQTFNPDLVATCKKGDLSEHRYNCYVCGRANSTETTSEEVSAACMKCKSVQAVGISTEMSDLAVNLHETLSNRFEICLSKLLNKTASIETCLQEVYSVGNEHVEDDGNVDDVSLGPDDLFDIRYVWAKQGLLELEAMQAEAQFGQLVGFMDCILCTKEAIGSHIGDVICELEQIDTFFDSTSSTFLVVNSNQSNSDDVNHLREKFQRLARCKKLISRPLFASFQQRHNKVRISLDAAARHCRDVTRGAITDSLGRLLEVHNGGNKDPDVKMELDRRFAAFLQVVSLEGSDLKTALDLTRSEGLLWLDYSPVKVKTGRALTDLVTRFGKLFVDVNILIKPRQGVELDFINDNYFVVVSFVQCSKVLSSALPHLVGLPSMLQRAVEPLRVAFNTFHSHAVEIEGLLSRFEVIVPVDVEGAIGTVVAVNFSDIARFDKVFSDLVRFWQLFSAMLSLEDSVLTVISVDKQRVEKLKSLLTVSGHMQSICAKTARVLEAPFQNAKTATPNLTDKDQFFGMLYFCYLFSKIASHDDVVTKFQMNVAVQVDLLGVACLDFIATVANSTAEKAHFDRFNILFSNLLSLNVIFVEFQPLIKSKLQEIVSSFDAKLTVLVDAAQLSLSEWEDWTHHFEKVSRQLIIVRSIAITVPAFDTKIKGLIVDLLDSYLVRGNDEDAKEFIARLGNSLETSKSNGVGQRIVEEFTVFHGHKTLIRNQQFEQVSVEGVLNGIRVLPSRSGNVNGDPLSVTQKVVLTKLCNRFEVDFWKIVDQGLSIATRKVFVRSIPGKVRDLAARVMSSTNSQEIVDGIFSIIVHSFAYWTLDNMKGYDTTPSAKQGRGYLSQPHPGQVVVVLRLFGLDSTNELYNIPRSKKSGSGWLFGLFQATEKSKIELRNHLAQIRTGEGKSIVLAVVATVLALLDFEVDIACYSEYLTQRDSGGFQFLFRAFGVAESIRYGTFKTLCESILNSRGEIRDLMSNTITGKVVVPIHGQNSMRVKNRILLADEVDVLFGSTLFGKGYNVLASLRGEEFKEIEALVRLIWSLKDTTDASTWHKDILLSSVYLDCVAKFAEWPFLIMNAAKKMLMDVRDTEHKVDKVDSNGIGYFDDDNNITYTKREGYKTMFAYMKANEADNAVITDKMVRQQMNILVKAGTLSYAEIPKLYSNTLGVSGTLDTQITEELTMLSEDYDIEKRTIIPSAYPLYTGAPQVFSGRLGSSVIVATSTSHYEDITAEIARRCKDNIGRDRAVLVFFKTDTKLEDYSNCDSFQQLVNAKKALKLVGHTSPEERDHILCKAVEEGQITLLNAAYGRGTDFNYSNKQLDERGGIHVVQTFLSEDLAEEIQLMGRTNRQGHPGTFSMVLSEGDLETGGITHQELENMGHGADIYKKIKQNRSAGYAKKCVQRRQNAQFMLLEHKASQILLDHMLRGDVNEIKILLEERNLVKFEFGGGVASRTILAVDGTGSMYCFFDVLKRVIKEVLRRINDLLKTNNVASGFELQIVVYRNYPSEKLLLQVSDWKSDPEDLFAFLDEVTVSGGCGGTEAVEEALRHVNRESDKAAVTQVIVVGDQGASTLREISARRNKVDCGGLQGEKYFDTTKFTPATYYKTELKQIVTKGIPVHTLYLGSPAKNCFEEISKETNGKSGLLRVENPEGAEQLTNLFASRVLENIQSKSGTNKNLYGEYLALHPFNDVGFV